MGVTVGVRADPEDAARYELDRKPAATAIKDAEPATLATPARPASPRAEVLGCPLDRVNLEEALRYCESVIETRGFAQHMAINAAKLVAMQDDAELRASVDQCELITADGQSMVWASQLLGDPLPCRVTGIDLMEALLARAAEQGYRVYLLGATAEVLRRTIARMQEDLPALNIAGWQDGYYADEDERAVADRIAAARPQILFVAMSSPRKEYFLATHCRAIDVPFVMGVGGALDVYAGLVRRAPLPIQRMGLEWLFRLVQEPRRLLGRYARTNARFLGLLVRELVRVRLRDGGDRAEI
jgi:N-acetylglucosaminyldiphosphoundecaprenol N-acetyl-beta-D-mannosaminyltransferase